MNTGYLPDPPDARDHVAPSRLTRKVGTIDMRRLLLSNHDQEQTKTCAPHAVVHALEIKRVWRGEKHINLSPAHLYYLTRQMLEPSATDQAVGVTLRSCAKALAKFGVCSEETWPFNPRTLFLNPGWIPHAEGSQNKLHAYHRIRGGETRVNTVIAELLRENPVVFGMPVGEEWNDHNGEEALKLPADITGQHAVCLVGWDGKAFIHADSQGDDWGDGGFGLLDPEIIESPLSQDFWTFT